MKLASLFVLIFIQGREEGRGRDLKRALERRERCRRRMVAHLWSGQESLPSAWGREAEQPSVSGVSNRGSVTPH